MKIRKFEARSMKEALDLVKTELGPDAVILNAKEAKKGFGIGGERSIEVTAAYSESSMHVRKFVESKLTDAKKDQFTHSSAKQQREVMQKVVENQLRRSQEQSRQNQFIESSTAPMRALTKPRIANLKYIDIGDDDSLNTPSAPTVTPPAKQSEAPILTQQAQQIWGNMEVQSLKQEIQELKTMLQANGSMRSTSARSAHPGFHLGVSYEYTDVYQKLTTKGISEKLAADIAVKAQEEFGAAGISSDRFGRSGRVMLDSLNTTSSDSVMNKSNSKFHFFVGPSGSGKTSLMIKMASHLTMREGKSVALVSTDNVKLGAEQEIRLFSQILNLPFIAVRNQAEWSRIMPYFEDVDCVLVDTAGLSLSTESTTQYLTGVLEAIGTEAHVHLVLSAQTDTKLLRTQVDQYLKVNPTDLCFTGLDQAHRPGTIFTTSMETKLPLFVFGVGAKIPEDFEFATAERLIDLIFDISKSQQLDSETRNQNSTRNNEV